MNRLQLEIEIELRESALNDIRTAANSIKSIQGYETFEDKIGDIYQTLNIEIDLLHRLAEKAKGDSTTVPIGKPVWNTHLV